MEKDFIKVDLEPNSSTKRSDFGLSEINILKVKGDENRKNKHEIIKHFISVLVIIPYVLLLFFGSFFEVSVSRAYESIALIIIGYYFAKHC